MPATLSPTVMYLRDDRRRIYIQFAAPLLQQIFDFSALFFLVDMPDVVRLIGKNEICHCAGSFDGQCLSGQLSSPPTEDGVHPPDIDWFGRRADGFQRAV